MRINNVFEVYFDGGHGAFDYGSWEVRFNGFRKHVRKERYPSGTSNTAEYMALISALTWLDSVKDKQEYRVEIYGDSMLVISQILQFWQIKKAHLKGLACKVWELVEDFGAWDAHWHERSNSVRIFGH